MRVHTEEQPEKFQKLGALSVCLSVSGLMTLPLHSDALASALGMSNSSSSMCSHQVLFTSGGSKMQWVWGGAI